VIRGILFHQGESDSFSLEAQQAWPGKVEELVRDLRRDLALGDPVPFLVGELLANAPPQNGCCGDALNSRIRALPARIPHTFVVPGAGLSVLADRLHYSAAGQREFGRRYAEILLRALDLAPAAGDTAARERAAGGDSSLAARARAGDARAQPSRSEP